MSMECVLPLVRASKILNKFCTEDFTFFNFHYTHKLCTGPDCVATSKTHLIGIRTFFGTDQVHYKNCVLFEYISKLWRRQWHPTPVLLPGKSHGQRSLVGCSPWGCQLSDMTERLQFQFSLSCIGEGNGNTLQCSCLENPRDGGAWWVGIYGVTQSWTGLKWLRSSSSISELKDLDSIS